MKRWVVGLVLVAGSAFAQTNPPPREVWHPYRIYQGVDIEQGQVDCTGTSGSLLTSSFYRYSVMFRNTGSADVYICATDTLGEGVAASTCTTAAAGIFLGGTSKDGVTLDQAIFGVGWSCITSSGTGTVKYYVER